MTGGGLWRALRPDGVNDGEEDGPTDMDEISRKVFVAIQAFIERLTKADNLTSDQLTEAHMATTALAYQLARIGYDPAAMTKARAMEEALAAKFPNASLATAAPRKWDSVWRAEVGAKITGLLERGGALDDANLLHEVRELLLAYHSEMDPVVSAGTRSTYSGGRGDAKADVGDEAIVELTAPSFEAWLHERGLEPADTHVTEVKRLMGGYSKATYIVKMTGMAGEKTLVIRKDGFGLPTGSSVVAEFPVLQEMFALGLPVPAPLWVEPDVGRFSTAFMGVTYEPGTPANHILPSDDATRRRWAESCGEVLGRLHRDTAQPDSDIRTVLAAEIDDLERRMRERERAPHPGLVIGLNWLRQHLDDLAGRPACRVHGDYGFHNFLMRDDRILAMLDWEFSHIGDPVEDLTSIKPFIDQLGCWDHCYATYQTVCGFALDSVADRYFNVWREVRNMVACLGSLNSLLLPPVKDIPLTVAGTIYIPKYEIAILDAITEADAEHV